jgi:DNA-binding LytR/AlgR family response regulator
MSRRPTALIADDEPLLRRALVRQLADAWPQLDVVAEARNGREAIARFEELTPDVCFLDVKMPGVSGVEAARAISRRAHVVFVTAYDSYAVQAFEQGALDYLVKPVEPGRLADTVARLQQRMREKQPSASTEQLLDRLDSLLRGAVNAEGNPLRWLQASVGQSLRLIPVEDVAYLRSDAKYTRVAWRGDDRDGAEALVRTALKDLVRRLDPVEFVQVHRSVVVNLRAVDRVVRGANETASIHLKERSERLPVSRTYVHLFRGM